MRLLSIVCVLLLAMLFGPGCGQRGEEVSAPPALTEPRGPTLSVAESRLLMAESARRLVSRIGELETEADVTCWTSFRQLDGFLATRMFSDHG